LQAFAVVNSFPYFESFETGFGVWQPDTSNQFDWSRNTGQTPSSNTGPMDAYDGDWYIFTESPGNNPDMTAALDGTFDFSALRKPEMTFYYFMYGNSMGNLNIDVNTGSWDLSVWRLTGEQQTWVTDSWQKATVDLSGYMGASNVTLRIRGVTGSSYTSDMCVDKVQIYDDVPRVDIEPIYSTGSGLPGANVNYNIKVMNKTTGSSDFNISYFNNPWSTLGPVTTGVIPKDDSKDLIIQVQIPSGTYSGDQTTSTIQIVSTDNIYTGTATIVTKYTWPTYPLPCETWDIFPHGWTNYSFASTAFPWIQSGIGNPAPGLYHPAYTALFTNWFVSPALNFDDPFAEDLHLMFDEMVIINDGYGYTGVLISDGNRNPASNDFVELLEIGDGSTSWNTRDIDLATYKGMNPVYFAFLYIGSNTHLPFIDNVCVQGKKYGIDNSFFVSPTSTVIECSLTAPTFVGQLYIDGETGSSGPASHVSAQMGIGPVGSLPTDNAEWIWYSAAYTGPDGIYDAFGVSPNISVVGDFDTDYSVSTSAYSMMSFSSPVSPVHIPAFKSEIESSNVPHSIGRPTAGFMKNNVSAISPAEAGEIVDKNHPALKPTPPKTGGELSAVSLSSMAATFYSPISCASGVPAYGMEIAKSPSITNDFVSFCTGTPGIITNIGVYSTDNDLIWASDFMPNDLNSLYALNDQNKFLVIDVTNVNITVLGTSVPSPGLDWTGMAIDPDGTIYANATDIARSELYTINPSDGTATLIGEIDNSPGSIAIAINANGKLYGIDIINNSLISINKQTGAGTIIGSLGFNANFGQGADFDYESGILYLAAYNQNTTKT